jgi:ABC transport system ATP-binding/permease protein
MEWKEMKMITIENLSKSYAEKQLFEGLSCSITDNERIGVIGVNGTGKSTFLKIIAGVEEADSGSISSSKGFTISYLPQQPDFVENKTVLEQVFHGDTPLIRLLKEYEEVLLQLEKDATNSKVQENLYQVQQRMDASNAWEANSNAKAVLTKLGIHDYDKFVGELSGGQKKRVALAQCLIETPDLLILDEPTNHLDYETIKWLEEYLARYNGALLLVTHDRYFLDRVTNRILELDQGSLYSYTGNYGDFLEAKAIREEQELASEAKRQNLYRRELAWIRKGAKARTTKQKARIQRFEERDMVSGPIDKEKVDIAIGGSRLGKKVLELKDVSKKFGENYLLKEFSFLIKPVDRIGIVGNNGTGKSTLLNILAGRLEADSGEVEVGSTVKIGYYTQENEDMNENQRMIEYIKESAEVIKTLDGKLISASQMLERFLFPGHTHGTPIRKLSGGEKRRLYLLKVLMSEPNVLFLDEPTNDLDTQTLTVLEDYIEDFPGVVITVSHDRYFLDKIAEQLIVLKGNGKSGHFYGSYTDYLEQESQTGQETPIKSANSVKEEPVNNTPKKRKLTYMEQKEWAEIEDKISKLEEKCEELETQIAQAGSDYGKIQTLMNEQKQKTEELEQLIERWEELSEIVEGQ